MMLINATLTNNIYVYPVIYLWTLLSCYIENCTDSHSNTQYEWTFELDGLWQKRREAAEKNVAKQEMERSENTEEMWRECGR